MLQQPVHCGFHDPRCRPSPTRGIVDAGLAVLPNGARHGAPADPEVLRDLGDGVRIRRPSGSSPARASACQTGASPWRRSFRRMLAPLLQKRREDPRTPGTPRPPHTSRARPARRGRPARPVHRQPFRPEPQRRSVLHPTSLPQTQGGSGAMSRHRAGSHWVLLRGRRAT